MQSDKTPFLPKDGDGSMTDDVFMNEEKFMDNEEHMNDFLSSRGNQRPVPRRQDGKSARTMVIIHAVLGSLNVLLLLCWIFVYTSREVSMQPSELDHVFSAESAIHHQYQRVDTHDHNDPFTGKPGPVVDQAWSDLLKSSTIRISEEELQTMNRSSISLPDGGYLAYLETYHMLHCVKRIYQFQYQENYPDVIKTGELTLAHWEHCLQVLRKGIMCNAGPSVNTYVRSDTGKLKGDSTAPRKCVDWSIFEAWADDRAVCREDYIESGLNGQ